jgi:hypothetical protein
MKRAIMENIIRKYNRKYEVVRKMQTENIIKEKNIIRENIIENLL